MFEKLRRGACPPSTATQLAGIVQHVLSLDDRWMTHGYDTPLLGAVPQLDSMAAVALLTEIERQFEIRIPDEDVSADMFTTFGDLLTFVEARLPGSSARGHRKIC